VPDYQHDYRIEHYRRTLMFAGALRWLATIVFGTAVLVIFVYGVPTAIKYGNWWTLVACLPVLFATYCTRHALVSGSTDLALRLASFGNGLLALCCSVGAAVWIHHGMSWKGATILSLMGLYFAATWATARAIRGMRADLGSRCTGVSVRRA
jgi:hypothetical protein